MAVEIHDETPTGDLEAIWRALFEDRGLGGLTDLIAMSPDAHSAYLMTVDQMHVYRQRKALNAAGVATQVWRGDEWWH